MWEYIHGDEDTNVSTDCEQNAGYHAKRCTASDPCNFETCKNYCEDDVQCNFFTFNIRGACTLYYDDCSTTRTATQDGVTLKKIRNHFF